MERTARPFDPRTPPAHWIGGALQTRPEDFRVEEIPLYPPTGEGAHLLVKIEKTGRTTQEVVDLVSRQLRLPPRAVGFAGRKDKQSVSVQTLSVPAESEEALRAVEIEGVRILETARHARRIAPGHLAGNRFAIAVRGVDPDSAERIAATAARVAREGVPNYFGPQRFGMRVNNHLVGAALLAGDSRGAVSEIAGRPGAHDLDDRLLEARRLFDEARYAEAERGFPDGCVTERRLARHLARNPADAEGAVRILPVPARRFYLNAWQSYVFNRVVEERRGSLSEARPGEVAVKPSGVAFVVEDAQEVAGRIAAGLVELSGPLPGKRSLIARGALGDFEREITRAALGVEPEPAFRRARLRGERRALRLAVRDLAWRVEGDGAVFEFVLPPGAFATTVLSEFMGPGPPVPRLEDVRYAAGPLVS